MSAREDEYEQHFRSEAGPGHENITFDNVLNICHFEMYQFPSRTHFPLRTGSPSATQRVNLSHTDTTTFNAYKFIVLRYYRCLDVLSQSEHVVISVSIITYSISIFPIPFGGLVLNYVYSTRHGGEEVMRVAYVLRLVCSRARVRTRDDVTVRIYQLQLPETEMFNTDADNTRYAVVHYSSPRGLQARIPFSRVLAAVVRFPGRLRCAAESTYKYARRNSTPVQD
jgi:hypothetical protein